MNMEQNQILIFSRKIIVIIIIIKCISIQPAPYFEASIVVYTKELEYKGAGRKKTKHKSIGSH